MQRGAVTQVPHILIVDDDPLIQESLTLFLRLRGYTVDAASTGRQALEMFAKHRAELIVLDLGLPDGDGREICERLRQTSDVPIIVLSARGGDQDKVAALERGADDYITKPFSIYELLARVKAHLRRLSQPNPQAPATILSGGAIELDFDRQRVTKAGQAIDLAPKEFGLLHVLLQNKGRVVTRQVLLDRVWGFDFYGDQQTVNVHIRWLREKIEDDPNDPKHIVTVRSRGYLFRD